MAGALHYEGAENMEVFSHTSSNSRGIATPTPNDNEPSYTSDIHIGSSKTKVHRVVAQLPSPLSTPVKVAPVSSNANLPYKLSAAAGSRLSKETVSSSLHEGRSIFHERHVMIVYDHEYADPSCQKDLREPLTSLTGAADRVTTWVLPKSSCASNEAPEITRLAESMVAHITSSIPSLAQSSDSSRVIVLLHADLPPGAAIGAEFQSLRSLLNQIPYTQILAHVPEYCENTYHKSRMNQLFAQCDVPHADFLRIASEADLSSEATVGFVHRILDASLDARIFLKVDDGFNSAGLTESCIVGSLEHFVVSAGNLIRSHGPVIAQRFLPGREFTVAVSEMPAMHTENSAPTAYAYHPIERVFKAGELFSPADGTMAERVMDAFAEPALADACRQVAKLAFQAVQGRGWGRVDVRCDAAGVVHVLEVNNTASFAPNSYLAMSCLEHGVSRNNLLEMIARCAPWAAALLAEAN